MDAGDQDAKQRGMSKAIYDGIFSAMEPKLNLPDEKKEPIHASWAQLAFAVATGVVTSLAAAPSGTAAAQVVSSSTEDTQFWTWFAGFAGVFNTWANSASPTIVTLQTSLKTFFQNNPIPTQIRGVLK